MGRFVLVPGNVVDDRAVKAIEQDVPVGLIARLHDAKSSFAQAAATWRTVFD
jgi:hypothetical protein